MPKVELQGLDVHVDAVVSMAVVAGMVQTITSGRDLLGANECFGSFDALLGQWEP